MANNLKKQFMIFGSFSGSNAGDMAILHVFVNQLNEIFPGSRFYVPTNVPSYFQKNSIFVRGVKLNPVSMRIRHLSYGFFSFHLISKIRRCNAVFTTANMFFDWHLLNPWNNYIFSLFPVLLFQRLFNRKALVIAASVSVNPPTSNIGKYIIKKVLELHDIVIVRDTNSAKIIRQLSEKINCLGCYPDLCVGQALVSKKKCNLKILKKNGGKIIGFNFSSYFIGELQKPSEKEFLGWLQFFASIIKKLKKNINNDVVFITTSSTDEKLAKEISKLLGQTFKSFGPSQYLHFEIYSLISQLDVYVTMRMHGAIFAFNAGIPCIGLCFTQKLRNFYTDYGLDEFKVDISSYDYNSKNVKDRLLKAINYAAEITVENRKDLSSKMAEKGKLRKNVYGFIKNCIDEKLQQ